MSTKKIIILAGGSGGHIFPALSIAYYLIKLGWQIRWIGTKNHIESKIVPENNIPIDFIHIKGLRNANFRTLISLPIYVLRACHQIKKIIKAWSPDIILGMGGYVSGPGGIAAWCTNIPLIIHEQNKIAGITNKWLSKISTYNMQAFSGTLINATTVGNPVRKKIIDIPSPTHRFKNRKGPLRILIMGGSQGAKILNDTIPQISSMLYQKVIIWHQIGDHALEPIKQKYCQKGSQKHIIAHFIDDISIAYAWADIVICRSGALTVSEISIVGLAAIFVPYPHKDQQQYLNALELKNIGAAKIIDQKKFNIKILSHILNSLNRKKLYIMANKAYSLGIRNSTSKIVKIIQETIENIVHEK